MLDQAQAFLSLTQQEKNHINFNLISIFSKKKKKDILL